MTDQNGALEKQITIELTPPSKDEPGYLRRMRQVLRFQELSKDNVSAADFDDLVDFLAGFVTNMDKAAAIEALWDASQEQIDTLLTVVGGAGDVPKASDNGSGE